MGRNPTSVKTELSQSWSSPGEWTPWEVQSIQDLIISQLHILSRRWGFSCPWLLRAFRTMCILNKNNSRPRGIPPEETFWHPSETGQHTQAWVTFLSALQKDTWDPTEVKRRQVQNQVHEQKKLIRELEMLSEHNFYCFRFFHFLFWWSSFARIWKSFKTRISLSVWFVSGAR